MIDKETLESLAQRLSEALPPGLHNVKEDMARTFHGILQTAFLSMNLVGREEFDARIDALESRIAALESKFQDKAD